MGALEDDIYGELRQVRLCGLVLLDNPGSPKIDMLEEAAARIPEYESGLTKGAAVVLLLEYEVPKVKAPGHARCLETLFGLRSELVGKRPTDLRTLAAKEAGVATPTFIRPGYQEQQALHSLAAQIEADCFAAAHNERNSHGPFDATDKIEQRLIASDYEPGWQPDPVPPVSQPAELTPLSEIPARQPGIRRLIQSRRNKLILGGAVIIALSLAAIAAFVSTKSDSDPIAIDSVDYNRANQDDLSFVFPTPLNIASSSIPPPVDFTDKTDAFSAYENWSLGHGGVIPGDAPIEISMHNATKHPLVITNMQVVKKCSAPLDGTLLYVPPQGVQADPYFYIDLDEAQAEPRVGPNKDSFFSGPHASTIHLDSGESSTLSIEAVTKRYYCQFRLRLVIDQIGKGVMLYETVDNHGQPFAVTYEPRTGPHNDVKFSYYKQIYSGGPSGDQSGKFLSADPASYDG